MTNATLLENFLEQFPTAQIPKGNILQLGKSYYLVNPLLERFVQGIPERPASVGLFLGEEKRGHFQPSANLLPLLQNHEEWLELDAKASWLFVCGRDVFPKSAAKQSQKTSGLVVVKNEQSEVLGLARYDKKGHVFKNLVDIGYFLRKEK